MCITKKAVLVLHVKQVTVEGSCVHRVFMTLATVVQLVFIVIHVLISCLPDTVEKKHDRIGLPVSYIVLVGLREFQPENVPFVDVAFVVIGVPVKTCCLNPVAYLSADR